MTRLTIKSQITLGHIRTWPRWCRSYSVIKAEKTNNQISSSPRLWPENIQTRDCEFLHINHQRPRDDDNSADGTINNHRVMCIASHSPLRADLFDDRFYNPFNRRRLLAHGSVKSIAAFPSIGRLSSILALRWRWDARARFTIISLLKNCAPLDATAHPCQAFKMKNDSEKKKYRQSFRQVKRWSWFKFSGNKKKHQPNTENASIGDGALKNHSNVPVTKRLWIFSHDHKLLLKFRNSITIARICANKNEWEMNWIKLFELCSWLIHRATSAASDEPCQK